MGRIMKAGKDTATKTKQKDCKTDTSSGGINFKVIKPNGPIHKTVLDSCPLHISLHNSHTNVLIGLQYWANVNGFLTRRPDRELEHVQCNRLSQGAVINNNTTVPANTNACIWQT